MKTAAKNVMIFGLLEIQDEELNLIVLDVFQAIGEKGSRLAVWDVPNQIKVKLC
jgi:hypothetical protein